MTLIDELQAEGARWREQPFGYAKYTEDCIRVRLNYTPKTITFQSRRWANGQTYPDPKYKAAIDELETMLKPFAPPEPWAFPVIFSSAWFFPCPKKKKPGWRDTRPDVDNLSKGLKDVLQRLQYISDDKYIVMEQNSKYNAEDPGLYFSITKAKRVLEVE